MIVYNMRYRGSYEYEKFVLNAFQYHNEVQQVIGEINNSKEKNLDGYIKNLDILINEQEKLYNLFSILQERVKL